jgi:phosphoenolpyruvate carboxykinase (GTP)
MIGHMTSRDLAAPLSTNPHLVRWVRKMADLARPSAIHWVDGSEQERDLLCRRWCEAER